mmetsp:Transcript_7237/g.20115  ORF Transcript_7237/g.20115 Transcript_7237/m.20115 type:complete len:203 (-) Transcript_7237:86-694(-)
MVEGQPGGPGGARGAVLVDRAGQDCPGIAAVGRVDGNLGAGVGRCPLHQAHYDGGPARHQIGPAALDVGEEEGPFDSRADVGGVVVGELLRQILGQMTLEIIDDVPATVAVVDGREGVLVGIPRVIVVAGLEANMDVLHVAAATWVHLFGNCDGGVGPNQSAAWFRGRRRGGGRRGGGGGAHGWLVLRRYGKGKGLREGRIL